MKHKIFRALLSLVLVCVLLISWSPIRVQATSAGATAGIITQIVPLAGEGGAVAGGATLGTAAFGYVLAGLGIVIAGAALLEMVDRYQEYSGELETSIYYYPDGTWSYGVDMGFVESVRAFLFDSGIVVPYKAYGAYVSDDIVTHSYYDNANLVTKEAIIRDAGSTVYSYRICDNGKHYDMFYSASPFKISYSGVTSAIGNTVGNVNFYYVMKNYGVANRLDTNTGNCVPGDFTSVDLLFDVVAKLISSNGSFVEGSSTEFEIEYVAPLEVPMPEAYPEWQTNARPATDSDTEEQIPIFPIPLKPNVDYQTQVEGVTQGDVWIGSIADAPSGTVPDVVPDTIGLSDIWSMIKSIPGALADVITGPIVGTLTDIWNFIKTIPGALADVITGPIVGGLTNIWDLITSIPQAIAEAISAIFVPEADFITEKWNAIRSRFAFADSIASSGEMILDVLQGIDPEPPVIYIDLGASEGSYDIGGEVPFLDLRWYERYKPTGDAIISAFLWLVFVWRMFIKLPGIIGGLPGDFVMQGVVNLGLSEHLPTRKKEYEYERQQNRRSMRK